MTSTNDGKDVKSNQTSGQKSKTYYIELYKSLEAGLSSECKLRERTRFLCEAWRRVYTLCHHSVPSTQAHLISWLQRHTSRTILQTEWQSPTSKDEHAKLHEAIGDFISESQNEADDKKVESQPWQRQLVQRGQWFQSILANPWGHPVLKRLLDSHGESPTDEEVLEWLKEERGVMFLTRLRQLASSKCDDLALTLASNVMDRVRAGIEIIADADQVEDCKDKPKAERTMSKFAEILRAEAGFTLDVWEFLTDLEFVLLLKRDKRPRCIQLAIQTPLRNGCKLVDRLHSRLEMSPREKKLWKNAKEVATLIAEVVVTRCMVVRACAGSVRSALYCMSRVLARTLSAHPQRLHTEAASLAAPAATARHLHTLAAAVRAELKDTKEMIPFMCSLYVRAITAGMNELERLKLKTEMETEARSAEQTLASWFTQLGSLLSTSDRIQCECTLTAFSVHPSPAMYEKIKAAPTLPPVALDHLDPKEVESTSEFGSWANDSRSMTNLVKTSETLNLKQTLHQANVLSTALLTEGEGLGLGAELCQDIAVLLSGPRLKTLSWDMDRELLLENCRAYMERTSGGTRAVTTELKYLNLDPKAFQHLPEEEDEENDMFYGIEKGYEHLVEFQEPEEMWETALLHPEMVDSPYASSIESEISTTRRKKKSKKLVKSSEEDSDPLSFMAEAKKKEKKKVRPHSKERSKERRKKKSAEDPLASRDGSQDSRKESTKKEKKKEKKERKKKDSSQPKPSSLARLVGMKVTNMDNKYTSSMTDSDYDSQGKSSLNSLNSEGTENVIFDGLYSMDELKSPEHVHNDKMGLMKNNEFSITDGIVAVSKPANVNKIHIDNNAMSPYSSDPKKRPTMLNMTSQPYLSTVREEVKKSISRLIEFRRKKKVLDAMNATPATSTSLCPTASASYKMPSAIVRPESPLPAPISPKVVTIPEIPKMYINKKQSEQLAKLKNEVNRYLNTTDSVDPRYSPIQFGQPDVERNRIQNFTSLTPTNPDYVADLIRKHSKNVKNFHPPPGPINMVSENIKQTKQVQNIPIVPNVSKLVNTTDTLKQVNFQDFLKELQESINAGAGVHSADNVRSAPIVPAKKELKPMSRPTPIIPLNMKIDNKTTPSAKPQTQPKKLDTSLNTFSRLSYMFKNKQSDMKLQEFVNALIEHQDQNLKKKPPTRVIDRVATEQKISRPKCQQAKIETTTLSVKSTPLVKFNNGSLIKKLEKSSTSVNPTVKPCPVIKSILQNNHTGSPKPAEIKSNNMHTKTIPQPHQVRHEPKTSLLSENDQNDLLLLLRQQNKLNTSFSIVKRDVIHNKDEVNANIVQNSTLSNVTSTKFNSSDESPICNKDMQANKPIYENHRPKKLPVLTGLKVQNYTAVVPKLSAPKTVNTPRNHSKTDSLEHNNIKKTEVKTDNKLHSRNDTSKIAKTATDWESVMDAILAQKTPSRGPKALDVALNKSSFAKAFSDSLQNQRLLKSHSLGELVGNKVIDAKLVSPSKEAPGIIAPGNKSHQNTHNSVPKKASFRKSSTESKHNSKISNSKTLPNSTDNAHLNISKSRSPEAPRKSNHHEPHKKLPIEELKKQFTCPLPKDDDPFISGIANSDYDLLEELMDDDLRQEIGELSTDEDDYNPSAPNVSKRKNITEKRIAETYSKLTNTLPITATAPMDLCTNQTRGTKKNITQIPNMNCDNKMPSIYGTPTRPHAEHINTKKLTSAKHITSSLVNENNSKIQTAHNLSMTGPTVVKDESVIAAESILPTLESSNVYIAAVPKQRYQNVVVINNSDLVYDNYPAVQTSARSNINNIQQNSCVPVSRVPNSLLYQTDDFTTPVVSPLVIGNCVTGPMSVTANKITSSVSVPVATFTTLAQDPKPVDVADNVQYNDNYAKPDLTCHTTSDRQTIDASNLPSNKIDLDFNSNKSCDIKKMSEVQEEQKLTENKVPKIDQVSMITQENYSNNNEHQERLAMKRISIINRKLSHRCDNEPIPLSFTGLDSGAYSTHYNKQPVMENNHLTQDERVPKIIHELKPMSNHDTATLETHKPKEHNESIILENKQNSHENIVTEGDCRRILLRSSNKLVDRSISLKQNSKNTNRSKNNVIKKGDLTSDKVTTVAQSEEKEIPKSRSRKRPLKKANKPNKTDLPKDQNKKEKVLKKSKAIGKNQKKSNKKALQHVVTSTNLVFPDIEDELLGSKIPRLFGSHEATLPNVTIMDKIAHQSSSSEVHGVGSLEGPLPRGPKPVDAELFDDLTQFSCDTVSFENIIKEKALLASEFQKENTALPIPVLTSTDIETVLEKEKPSTINKLSFKENISMNLNMTSDREISEKLNDVKKLHNSTTLTESSITQASVSTIGLEKDNAPFFKQVLSEIALSKADQQKRLLEVVNQKHISDDVERQEIANEIHQKQTSDEVERQEIVKGVKQKQIIQKVTQKQSTEEVERKEIAEKVTQNQTTKEVERKEIPEEAKQKLTIYEGEQNQVADYKEQVQVIDELPQKPIADDVEQIPGIHEAQPIEIEDEAKQTQINIEQKQITDRSSETIEKQSSKVYYDISSVKRNVSIVNVADNNQSKELSNKSTSSPTEIPQSYKDSIKIEQIPGGSKDPLKKCLRIKLPNGRTFKATVHGKVLLNVDALFEEPSLKSLLLSSLTDKKFYTLNIKQVSKASADNPNKIVETRIQEINIQPKTAPNLVETINLLSDDEDEEVYQYFKTEIGKFKIRPLSNSVFSSHQNKLNQKCQVDLLRMNFAHFDKSIDISDFALFKNIFKKQINSETINTSKRSLRRNPIPTKKMSALLQESEVIQIDDSSNESFVYKQTYREEVKNKEPIESAVKSLKDLNLNCYIKLNRCDALVKKYETLKALNKKCYVDLVRIDSTNLNNVNSDENQAQPIPSHLDEVTNGRTSPVMEAYELIARVYHKSNKKLNHTKQLEKHDTYLCKSLWLETKRNVSKLAIENKMTTLRNGLTDLRFVDTRLKGTIPIISNQTFNPLDLKTLILKHFQNSLTLNYTCSSRTNNIPKCNSWRRTSYLLKRKQNTDHKAVSNKISKLNIVNEGTRKENQFIEIESSCSNSNILTEFKENQEIISMETTMANSEENIQNDPNTEMDCIQKDGVEGDILDELCADSDSENSSNRAVASDERHENYYKTETRSDDMDDNSTTEKLCVKLQMNTEELENTRTATKSISNTEDSTTMTIDITPLKLDNSKIDCLHTENVVFVNNVCDKIALPDDTNVKNSTRSNGVTMYEPILKNENDMVNIDSPTEYTNIIVSNYSENNNSNATQSDEIDKAIYISNYDCIKASSEPADKCIQLQELKPRQQNKILIEKYINHDKMSVNQKHCNNLLENCEDEVNIPNRPIKSSNPGSGETQEELESITVIKQELGSSEPNAFEENKTAPVVLKEENHHAYVSIKHKHSDTLAENLDVDMDIPNKLIEISSCELYKAHSEPDNATEKAHDELQKTEHNAIEENRTLLTGDNNDEEKIFNFNLPKPLIGNANCKSTETFNNNGKSNEELEIIDLNEIIEKEKYDHRRNCEVVTENNTVIKIKPIDISNCELSGTCLKSENTIDKAQKEIKHIQHPINENKINFTNAKNSDCHSASSDIKHCDSIKEKSENDTRKSNKLLETCNYKVSEMYLETKNVIAKAKVELETSVQNATEHEIHTTENTYNDRYETPINVKRCDTMIENFDSNSGHSNKPFETLNYEVTETHLQLENPVEQHIELESTVQNMVEENKAYTIKKKNNDRDEAFMDVKHCNTDMEISYTRTGTSNKPFKSPDFEVNKTHLSMRCDETSVYIKQYGTLMQNCDSDKRISNEPLETMDLEVTETNFEPENMISQTQKKLENKTDETKKVHNNGEDICVDVKWNEMVVERTDYVMSISNVPLKTLHHKINEIISESENMSITAQVELETNCNSMKENDGTQNNDSNKIFIDVKFNEIVSEKNDYSMSISNASTEAQEKLERTDRNKVEENKIDGTEKESKNYDDTYVDGEHDETLQEKTDYNTSIPNALLETCHHKTIETISELKNTSTKVQKQLATTDENTIEKYETYVIEKEKNDREEIFVDRDHCETVLEKTLYGTGISYIPIETLDHKINETHSKFENACTTHKEFETTAQNTVQENKTVIVIDNENNDCDKISLNRKHLETKVKSLEDTPCICKDIETLKYQPTELHSQLEISINKIHEEFETIAQNAFTEVQPTEPENIDLDNPTVDVRYCETKAETCVNDPASLKIIGQDNGENQEAIENLDNTRSNQDISRVQGIVDNDYQENHIFSNVENKIIIIGDHDYVGDLSMRTNESVKTAESGSESLKNKETNMDATKQATIGDDCNVNNTVFNLLLPKNTYKRSNFQERKFSYEKKSKRIDKRKKDMSDFKYIEKRYRKGKQIDNPKCIITPESDTTYCKEYKGLSDYNSSVKFSYSRSFHKEHIEVHELLKNWPIINTTVNNKQLENDSEELLFLDLENRQNSNNQTLQTLADELLCEDIVMSNPSDEIKETNFNMGFGERSGRVILNLEDEVDVSEVSAATLSDVKQNQPVLQSEHKDIFFNSQNIISYEDSTKKDLIESVDLYYTSIQLKNKVKDFFNKSAIELNLMQDYGKSNKDCDDHDMKEFIFGVNYIDFMNPPPVEITVQVVQVGQLPVSAAAQNPVTCDPRVTQVSDASPPQCSAENSPHDDQQITIKTEYTELTTADITLPMVHEYEHHEQSVPYGCQESSNIPIINENIPIQTEIKSVVKIELMEEEEKMESNEMIDHNECETPDEEIVNHVDYSFEINRHASPDSPPNIEMMYNDTEKQCNGTEEFSPLPQQNGFQEKTDQIAHAMNAAGISTTSEPMSNSDVRDDHDYNMLSQNANQDSTLLNGNDTYPKPTSINTMALQHALAQILPPPLNQVGSSSENNQQSSNTVTSQVLHIVQGKNSSGNQVTLVDNAQPSVINTPNATPVLHIVQNKSATVSATSNGAPTAQSNTFSGLSLVDATLQKGGNQLLHIVNAGNQNNNNAGQLLKRVNLLTNLTNAQVGNEQKMVQFVCKSADGKPIQLNSSHQRSMVLRLQPVETPTILDNSAKSTENPNPELSPTHNVNSNNDTSQEIKSRSVYEENYAKFLQGGPAPSSEKATSLPKFNQAFGKQVYQEEKQNELNGNSHLSASSDSENPECASQDNPLNLDHMGRINSPPLLLRKSPSHSQTTQSQPNIVQQIKETIAPMNIQTMHGGVIYTRQIPVNIGGGQTINLITVPTTELVDESGQKQQTEVKFVNQSGIEPSIIKIVPQTQSTTNGEASQENNSHAGGSNENNHNAQPQPVLTQMRIKLPMLSKAPNMVSGARVIRPSFFHIQRNVIGGPNQQVYQQLVLTTAPQIGQQTIRLPQAQNARPQKTPENRSTNESQMSTSTLEQLREFDLVLEQVKERSTVQPNGNTGAFSKISKPSTDTTDSATNASSTTTEPTQQQVLYSIGNTQPLNVAYVNRKTSVPTPTTSTYVRSPDSSGIVDSSTSSSSSQASTSHTVTTEARANDPPPQPKKSHKSKSRPKASSNPPNTLKLNTTPPKPSSQKPLEDEQTTQRILYILAEYKEQVENSPDKDKPAPRRRNNPPTTPSGSSKRKKGSGSRRHGPRDMSPIHGDETCRTMGSEDSSCGTSLGDCNDSCVDSHSPQDSPRKVVRKLTFDQEPHITQPRPQPQRNVIVADGQTITVARGTAGKPTTAVLMPANYILPVSMVKGGQQIAIVTNRGPKLLTVSNGGEGGTTNALLLQRLIGPAGLKPVLARPGFRHVRLPAAALHNLQAFNLTTATTVQPPDSTASPAPAPTPPDLVETRATSSPWTDRESQEVKPERGSSPEGSEPWNLHSVDPHDYSYEETVRTENMDRTVLVVHKREGHRQHRFTHVSAAALRHKYAILEHELRLQKSLSEECEDLGVDSPSASELFPEAELLFTASPAHDHAQEHLHSSQPIIHIPKPDLEDQIATDRLISRDMHDRPDLNIGLEDVGIVTVSEDGMQTTIALNQEEFARAHPNTTFHREPSEEGEVQPFTITGLKSRHITSTIFHANRGPGTVLVTAPQTTVISQATAEPAAATNSVKYADIENMIDSLPGAHHNTNLPSVLVKDDGLSRFDSLLSESREVHISNTTSAIVHSSGHATQVIRRVCFDDDKRQKDGKYLIDEPDAMMAGDDAKMEDISRDAALGAMRDDVEDRSSPERHAELFWDSSSMAERMERRRRLDFSSDSDKCCKSPTFDEGNSDSGVGVHMRLDSVIKEARVVERTSIDGPSMEDNHPPLRTYPPKRLYHNTETEMDRSMSGKTGAVVRSPDMMEVRRRASVRGVVKRGCHCCNGSPAPPRPKKARPRKPTMDFTNN